jgi:MinD-like ATPase involved in chromosome partitioning or flagellar assembly
VHRPGSGPDPESWWERYGHRVAPPGGSASPQGGAGGEAAGGAVGPGRIDAAAGSRGSAGSAAEPAGSTADPSGSTTDPPGSAAGPARVAAEPRRSAAEPAGSATELVGEAIVRDDRRDEPGSGWRRALLRLSGGVVNPGPGPVERQHRELLHRIRRPLLQTRHIAVLSMKGGVGRTTVASLLGLVLAENRGDRVIAVDANPDAGTLADRLTGGSSATSRDLLRDLDDVDSWAAVSHYTSLVGRLQVLAAEPDPVGDGFGQAEYGQVCALLERYFNIIITDAAAGVLHPATAGALARAHSLIVVGAPTVDGAGRASKTLDWLWSNGYGPLAGDAVAVLSSARSSPAVNSARIREHFAQRCRAVVDIPYDPQLAVGGRVELARLQPATRAAAFRLAALMADDFAG